jgi:hypothetical protein
MRALVLVAVLAIAGTAVAKPKPKPDLKVLDVAHGSGASSPGNFFSVSAHVKDAGKATSKKTLTIFFLEKPGGGFGKVGQVLTKKFASGQKRTVIGLLTTPAYPDGDYRLKACADGGKVVKERKEGNNCKLAKDPVTIRAYAFR